MPADILSTKLIRRLKTDSKRRAALLDCLYDLTNKEKGCLRKIILNNYKEQCLSIGTPGCCSNYDPLLQAYKEFNIRKFSTADIKLPHR